MLLDSPPERHHTLEINELPLLVSGVAGSMTAFGSYDDLGRNDYILLFDRSRSIVCRSNAWGF